MIMRKEYNTTISISILSKYKNFHENHSENVDFSIYIKYDFIFLSLMGQISIPNIVKTLSQ